MLKAERSAADLLFCVGAISLLAGFAVWAGGSVSDARVAIVGGKMAAILGAALFAGGILLQAIQSAFQGRLESEPRHSSFSKSGEIKFGLMFFLKALVGWKGPGDLTADDRQAPLPPLLGLVPGLFLLCCGPPLLYVGVAGFLGHRAEDGFALSFFFTASGGILSLFALAFLIPAVRDLVRPRS